MRKTRIRQVRRSNCVNYYPEYKLLWWWEKIYGYEFGVYHYSFMGLDKAKEAIDKFLEGGGKPPTNIIIYP